MQFSAVCSRQAFRRYTIGASMLVLSGALSSAYAQDISAAGAQQLQDQLSKYLSPAAFSSGVLTITPGSGAYDLTFNGAAVSKIIDAAKVQISAQPFVYHVVPKGDNTYTVTSDSPMVFSVKGGSGKDTFEFSMNFADCKSEGVFDGNLGVFSNQTASCEKGDYVSQAPGQRSETHYGRLATTMTGTASANGADVTYEATGDSATQTVVLDEGKVNINVRMGKMTQKGTIKDFRSTGFYALVAKAILIRDRNGAVAIQDELKQLARNALPLFESTDAFVNFDGLSVDTPVGTFSAASGQETVYMTGLTKDGAFKMGFKVTGLKTPEGIVPEWAKSIVPENVDLNIGLQASNLDEIARTVIDGFDARQDPPLPEAMKFQLLSLLMQGNPRLTLADSTVTAPSASLKAGGDMSLFPQQAGKVNVSMTGIDAITSAIAGSDLGGKEQVLMGLTFAKGLGKAGADGSTVWDIDFDIPSKKVTVNGNPLPLP